MQRAFVRDGVRLVLGARSSASTARAGREDVAPTTSGGTAPSVAVDEILVGAGRAPNVEGLGLEAVGVEYDARRGVNVNDRLRTTNPRIYAAGDVCMRVQVHARRRRRGPGRDPERALPRAQEALAPSPCRGAPTPTPRSPTSASTSARPHERGIAVRHVRGPFAEVDRAVTDGEEDGFVKVHVQQRQRHDRRRDDRRARHAGEMINELTLAMTGGIGLGALANVIHPYPTQAEAIRQDGRRLQPHAADADRDASSSRAWLGWTR